MKKIISTVLLCLVLISGSVVASGECVVQNELNEYTWINIKGTRYLNDESSYHDLVQILPEGTDNSINPRSVQSSIVIDSFGFPHIAWSDIIIPSVKKNRDIFYAKWDGKEWVCYNGESFMIDNNNDDGYKKMNIDANVSNSVNDSQQPSLKLDSNDNPCISWCEREDRSSDNKLSEDVSVIDIFYVHIDSDSFRKTWVCANGEEHDGNNTELLSSSNVSGNNEDSTQPQLEIDSSDNPHIVWENGQGKDGKIIRSDIYYAHFDNNTNKWLCANDKDYERRTDSYNAQIAYQRANVSDNDYGTSPSLALDSNDCPHISWTNAEMLALEPSIFYAKWGGEGMGML